MLEIFSIHLFLIFNVLLEMYNCWLLQIAQLENVKGQLPIEGAPAVWSGEEWIYVQPFIDLKKSDTAVEETVDKSNEYFKPSVLNKEHDDFFAELAGVVDGEASQIVEPAVEPHTEFDAGFESLVSEFESSPFTNIVTDEPLTMEDWHEEEKVLHKPMSVKSHVANAQIQDYVLGEQDWIVEVVGEEQGYLHVSDGSARAWVNSLKYGSFRKGDILFMNVTRTADRRVDVNEIDVLQTVSDEFLIPDEVYFEEYESKREIAV